MIRQSIFACWMILFSAAGHADVTADDPLPTKLLTCGGSVIKEIGSRLEGDEELRTGFHVWLKNGGVTVDYETPEAVRSSKAGDHVLVCLIYIPKKCPPGDDRGRVYTVTNLRTLRSWSAADSQHSCGGA
jgi:hypothetical protein